MQARLGGMTSFELPFHPSTLKTYLVRIQYFHMLNPFTKCSQAVTQQEFYLEITRPFSVAINICGALAKMLDIKCYQIAWSPEDDAGRSRQRLLKGITVEFFWEIVVSRY